MSLYGRDDHALLDAALRSISDQELPKGMKSHLYLGIDGPIDSTLEEVVERHRDRIYCLHRKERNGGLAAMLNDLISLTGAEEYLFRMDADDRSLSERFTRQIDYLEKNPHIDIVGTAIVEHDLVSGSKRIIRFALDPVSARRDMSKRPPLAHPTACFRRGVFEKVGGYPIVPFSEDIALWFRCLEAGLVFDNLPEPLYEFTINSHFWKRRGIQKAWVEYRTWSKGVHRLEGPTWHQIFPLARFLMRIGPNKVQKILYGNFLRRQAELDSST